jgi:hypothetical protein
MDDLFHINSLADRQLKAKGKHLEESHRIFYTSNIIFLIRCGIGEFDQEFLDLHVKE